MLHYSAFKDSILLSHDDCPENVMHEQVKGQLADTECKLNIILVNYKQIGMGDGHPQCQNNLDNSNSDDDGLEFQDGSDKASFLGSYKPHILYFWQLMEDNHLLNNCNVCLKSSGVSSEKHSDTTSSTMTHKCQVRIQREREMHEEEKQNRKFCKSVCDDLFYVCITQSRSLLVSMMEKKRNAEQHGDAELASFYEREIKSQKKEMNKALSKHSDASTSSSDSDE